MAHTYTLCTSTRHKALLLYKINLKYLWQQILEQPKFKDKSFTKQTLQRNYQKVMDNDKNCYITGQTDNSGERPKRISEETLHEATNRID